MSAAPKSMLGLVEVPCAVIHAGSRNLTVRIAGKIVTIERRYVVDWTVDGVTVPDWLARELAVTPLDACMSVADVARRFGASTDWLYRNLARLTERDGFPHPVSTVGQRRFDPARVEAWFARDPAAAATMLAARGAAERDPASPRQTPARAFSEPHERIDDDDMTAWRAALTEEYAR